MDKMSLKQLRRFLSNDIRITADFSKTDQNLGVEPPSLTKSTPTDYVPIPLVKPKDFQGINDISVKDAINNRKSKRKYSKEYLTIEELSYLLWTTQGVRHIVKNRAFRTVPSAGCRHPFETYLALFQVEGLEEGIYRYLPLTHELILESQPKDLKEKIIKAANDQPFAGNCAVTFIWSVIPYRTEWRYDSASHKIIALDAGHICQNLYLACESIDAGTCAIAAYDQKLMDSLIQVDGEEEFVIYLSPVGKNL